MNYLLNMGSIYPMNKLHEFGKYFINYEFPINLSELDNRLVLITGGTGFVGIWLLSLFKFINDETDISTRVTVVSRNPDKFITKYPSFVDLDWLNWIIGDIRDFSSEDIACDYVIHGATDTSIASHNNYSDMFDTIICGTKNILEFSKLNRCKRTLLISSGAAYGRQDSSCMYVDENTSSAPDVTDIRSVYGEAKRCMEMLGTVYGNQENLHVNYARCFTFMGPGLPLDGQFAFGNFIQNVVNGSPIKLNTNGSSVRSYLHGADLAVWLLTVMINGRRNEIYNIGSSEEITIRQLATLIKATLAPQLSLRFSSGVDTSPTGLDRYIPSTVKTEQLGCTNNFSLIEGITHTYNYAISDI